MLCKATTATPWGIDARPVHVEVDVHGGQLPGLQIVGLPDAAVRESRERVRRAVRNCGFELRPRTVLVNLAPADLRKEGNHLDLGIALALLAGHGLVPEEILDNRLFVGELGLDGSLRPVRGGLAIAGLARRLGLAEVLLPAENAGEAAAWQGDSADGAEAREGPAVIPVASLAEAVAHLLGETPIEPAVPTPLGALDVDDGPDLAEVRGQEAARRALEVAAAGGHNLLFVGPPGSGKTMLARRLPGLLPPLTRAEAVEVTKLASLVADEPPSGLVRRRPFRSPHAGISTAALVGGGSIPRPGEVSLAHNGVLFLDELPEFKRDTLEALRQPLEDARVTIARARSRLTFPARVSLVASMNPCPCGHRGDPRHDCRCPPQLVRRYRGKISGPLMDRIDLQVEVPAVGLAELRRGPGESTTTVAARVAGARGRQARRFGPRVASPVNAAMGPRELERWCRLEGRARELLDTAFRRLGLSARALHRILKVARTIADLAERDGIEATHVAEAIQYRSLDRPVVD